MASEKPTTVDEYLAAAPAAGRELLTEMRALLKSVAPDAREGLKWGQPAFESDRLLFSFAGFKQHLNFFPTQSALEPFRDELTGYKTGKGSVQFPYGEPLPVELIRKIAAYRKEDVEERGALWMK
ncbi:uncharacterized protein YdhG (YjbR/CyaY superfamily) [Neolewinella xylanilytica]|uniref:Uncharacterized protein YdhG (YjbR/CyaY superfamily) n=1 Tax=Neolewinella xylanilytica TaxID=1514080 RepID=A0A2S6I6Z1_9BACT|nr:DUF1801 domain-containing protein [Neolewinella xylanilytica]PPK87250.1 uncharacterized protein YdhG (YjbR/CyaY superfamily) [Neolewinella xylanilytica]